MPKAILIMAYGGPDSLDDIEPYLLDIRGGRPTSPALVEEIRARYARIGGKSPLLEITRAQAAELETQLNRLAGATDSAAAFRVFVGMRHWKPYIREAVAQISAEGLAGGLAICMAPHASRMSSGAYQQRLREAEKETQPPLQLEFINSWHDQPFLIDALACRVRRAVEQFPAEQRGGIHYLFTAHSLPASLKEQGDPYPDQLIQTARLLASNLGLIEGQWSFGYQSAGAAAVPWLGPAVEEMLPELAARGKRNVLITPVGFMADHVEILFDLDIEAQEIAHQHGIRLVRSESLNAAPDFITGLAKFIFERAA